MIYGRTTEFFVDIQRSHEDPRDNNIVLRGYGMRCALMGD